MSVAGRQIEYRLVRSKSATKLRVRVGMDGVQVIQPPDRKEQAVSDFLKTNSAWIVNELDRVDRLRGIRLPQRRRGGAILYRGELTLVRIAKGGSRGPNKIILDDRGLMIVRSSTSKTTPSSSLENWLRKQARTEVARQLDVLTAKLRRKPHKVLIMGQRTKWGNCSSMQNLSFNWRLIMAPDFVLRYLVTHEAVHLAIPDHSHKFWLTVRSLCHESERARQWLRANGDRLLMNLRDACNSSAESA
jgi:predicted metal-dependent hydrolase